MRCPPPLFSPSALKCHPNAIVSSHHFSITFAFSLSLIIRKTSEKKGWSAASGQALLSALPFKPCCCRFVILKKFRSVNMPPLPVPSVLFLLLTAAPFFDHVFQPSIPVLYRLKEETQTPEQDWNRSHRSPAGHPARPQVNS